MANDALYHANNSQTPPDDNSSLVFSMPSMETGEWSASSQSNREGHLQVRPVFQFDPRVAREIILYIAATLGQPSFHQISKLFYFADKLHLTRYGRLINGDRYIAMDYGPVPSNVYDMLKAARNANGLVSGDIALGFSVRDGRVVIPQRPADLDWISDSERECLDQAIADYGSLSFRRLTEESHDLAWQRTAPNREIALEAIIASTDNPEKLLEHLRDPHP